MTIKLKYFSKKVWKVLIRGLHYSETRLVCTIGEKFTEKNANTIFKIFHILEVDLLGLIFPILVDTITLENMLTNEIKLNEISSQSFFYML